MWKKDWPLTQENLLKWWNGEGLALCLTAHRSQPLINSDRPVEPSDWEKWWTDPIYRSEMAEYDMARTSFLAEAFPYFDTQIGPGSLGTFIGSEPNFVTDTVWYTPSIIDPDCCESIGFYPDQNPWWQAHLSVIKAGLSRCRDNYLVGMPDLIENIDTLAQLRGPEPLLYDLVERPDWVHERLIELNQIYFDAFDRIYDLIKDGSGGNAFAAFKIWGPGKTAKIQCDFSAMISPAMYAQFVFPYLEEQCEWLDFSLYHLDGTNALQHVDHLLSIQALNAIEWTPQAGKPNGGSPEWYDLYRRIKEGGKSIQVIGVTPNEVIPLLDAVGPKGTMILMDQIMPEMEAEQLLKCVEPYYR